jgi:hypothetical protein
MGSTVPYGLRFPVGTDVPDVPVRIRDLAEDVNDEVSRLDGDIGVLTLDVADAAAAASNVQVLDTIDSGSGTNTTEFSGIDQTYRDLMILWRGTSDGTAEIDSLALRFNGDGGDNYHSRLSRNLADGAFMSTDGELAGYVFSVLRAGYVGAHRSVGVIHIPGYRSGLQKYAHGTNVAIGNSLGTNIFNVNAGGRWTNSAAITAIRIWPSGQLWSGNPSITLIGIK